MDYDDCPLCLEPLDSTDRCFKPCKCGYQMCRFCWHHVKENLDNRCPACRQTYDPQNYEFSPEDYDELSRREQEKKQKQQHQDKSKRRIEADTLADRRVIQSNLVYITNISLELAKEEILKRYEYFGQYGRVIKLVVNKAHIYQGVSVSCYVTFARPEEALRCIEAADAAELNGRTLGASFGTTKYCSSFMRNKPCTNPDCMYLHELGDDRDSFSKEDMQAGKHIIRIKQLAEMIRHNIASGAVKFPIPKRGMATRLPPPKDVVLLAGNAPGAPGSAGNAPVGTQNGGVSDWKTMSMGPTPTAPTAPINTGVWAPVGGSKLAQSTSSLANPNSPTSNFSSSPNGSSGFLIGPNPTQTQAPSATQPAIVTSTLSTNIAPPVLSDEDFPLPSASTVRSVPKATLSKSQPASKPTLAQEQKPKVTPIPATANAGGSAWKATPQPQAVSIQAELQKGDEKTKKQQQTSAGNSGTSNATARAQAEARTLPASASWASKTSTGTTTQATNATSGGKLILEFDQPKPAGKGQFPSQHKTTAAGTNATNTQHSTTTTVPVPALATTQSQQPFIKSLAGAEASTNAPAGADGDEWLRLNSEIMGAQGAALGPSLDPPGLGTPFGAHPASVPPGMGLGANVTPAAAKTGSRFQFATSDDDEGALAHLTSPLVPGGALPPHVQQSLATQQLLQQQQHLFMLLQQQQMQQQQAKPVGLPPGFVPAMPAFVHTHPPGWAPFTLPPSALFGAPAPGTAGPAPGQMAPPPGVTASPFPFVPMMWPNPTQPAGNLNQQTDAAALLSSMLASGLILQPTPGAK